MTALSEFYLKYLDFLDLDPTYRITDFANKGATTSGESLTIAGPVASWQIANDRGQILFSVAPTELASEPRNWFRLSIIRQYLDDYDETNTVRLPEAVAWIRNNQNRIEDLFSDGAATASCEPLTALEDANGEVADAFGQPGGGTQWVVVDNNGEIVLIHDLIEDGYLARG